MNLPIDTGSVNFLAAGSPEVVTDFATKQPKTTADGQLLYSVPVIVVNDEGAEAITIRIAGEPKGVTKLSPVRITGLVANPWSMNDRSGISYRADSMEAIVAPARASS